MAVAPTEARRRDDRRKHWERVRHRRGARNLPRSTASRTSCCGVCALARAMNSAMSLRPSSSKIRWTPEDGRSGHCGISSIAMQVRPGRSCFRLRTAERNPVVPSISGLAIGPSADWHEREVEDLFGIAFAGHPRLGEFVLHEDWPEGINPMRRAFDARRRLEARKPDPRWEPPTDRRGAGRFRHANRPGLLRFRGIRAFPARDRRRGRNPHDPALLLQISRRREDRRGAARRPRAAARRAIFRHRRIRARLGASARRSRRSAASTVPPRAEALRTHLRRARATAPSCGAITGICDSTALAVAQQPGGPHRGGAAAPQRRDRRTPLSVRRG